MDFTDETIPMPRIGDQAPVFDAVTTQGKIHFPLDFNGKWIILFSHPSDFTPVCTSEFVTFGAMTEEFKALNCQLIGLSVDGLYSHSTNFSKNLRLFSLVALSCQSFVLFMP